MRVFITLCVLVFTAGAAEDKAPMKLIFYGDSITGWSDLSRWFKYSHIVECMLEARSGPGNWVVLNRGVGGNTSADLLARLDRDVLVEKPDIVVLLTGGNDGALREASAANIDQLATRITAVCPRLLLMQYHLTMVPGSKPADWKRGDDGADLVAAAAARHHLPLLDMAPAFLAAVDDSVAADEPDYRRLSTWQGGHRHRLSDLLGQDGIHLNGAGEIIYARSIFAKLLGLGWLP